MTAGTKRISLGDFWLSLCVLGTNAAVMGVELLATRLLFPRFGNTVFTWSAVIAIIVAGLFLGYLAGGWLSERSKSRPSLAFAELLVSGILVSCVPWAADFLLLAPAGAPSVHPPLAGCFVVFGLPAAALAGLSPVVVGIWTAQGRSPSVASGVGSALAAAGSILGTMGTVFWLVPSFGVRGLFVSIGVGLAALAVGLRVCLGGSAWSRAAVALALYAGGLFGAAKANARPVSYMEAEPIFSKDSAYQLVRVFEEGAGMDLTRLMMLDSTHEGAMRLADKEMVFEYTRAWRVFPNIIPPGAPARLLFIGGGAFSMPLRAAEALPAAAVIVAEVDPVVDAVARKYFRAGEAPNLSTRIADGRQALRAEAGSLDGVFVDAYQGVMSIPFHLTTREFFAEVRRSLKADGVLALNVIGDVLEKEGFFCAVAGSLAAEFPEVRIHPIHGLGLGVQNIIVVAGNGPDGVLSKNILAGTGFENGIGADMLACRPGQAFTDDHAPAEWLVARYLRR